MSEAPPTFVVDGSRPLGHEPARVWAAIADPEAYFSWNTTVVLKDEVPSLQPEMTLRIYSSTLGNARYVQRNDEAARTVLHDVGLSIRFIGLGRELHHWAVSERDDGQPGCVLHQRMEVWLTTWLGRRMRNMLTKQLTALHAANFATVDGWLASAPALDGRGRFPSGAHRAG